jgi:FMN phosphatase YigB (HAD superfamily)
MEIILLDIGNVIVSVDFEPFCRAVARDGDAGAGVIRSRYCEGELKDRLDRGQVSPDDFLRVLAADHATVDRPSSFFRMAWQEIFSPLEGSFEGIRCLREGYRLWIMSDTDPLHFDYLIDNYPVMRDAERFFLSYEHGFLKSEQEAFLHVLECSGLEPDRFTLLDDRQLNVDACRKTGMGGMLFTSWHEVVDSPLCSGRRARP